MRRFLWFHAFDECEPEAILPWFRATFTLRKITVGGMTAGIQLDMQTDAPWGYGEEIEETFVFTPEALTKVIEDKNEEVGITWPETVITCMDSGELMLMNDMTGCKFRVRNCEHGEVVRLSGDTKIIGSGYGGVNVLKLSGSEHYMDGVSGVHGGYTYTVHDGGVITLEES